MNITIQFMEGEPIFLQTLFTFIKNPSTWLSIASLGIAIWASFQTKKQIELSNKHQLFDRRLKHYLLFKELLLLYKNGNSLINEDMLILNPISIYHFLTSSTIFNRFNRSDNQENVYESDQIVQIELRRSAIEIELIWNNDYGKTAGKFVREYVELLDLLHRQEVYLNLIRTKYPDYEERKRNAESFAKEYHLVECVNNIFKTYIKICDEKIEEKLVKCIEFEAK